MIHVFDDRKVDDNALGGKKRKRRKWIEPVRRAKEICLDFHWLLDCDMNKIETHQARKDDLFEGS